MAIVSRRPFGLEDFFGDWMEWPTFDVSDARRRTPLMDIYEEDDNVVAEVEMPGMEPEDVNVEFKDNVLRVEAQRKEKREEKDEELGYYCKELSRGYYRRAVPLPVEVEDEKAQAEMKDGVLRIIVPKVEEKKLEEKGTKIKIKKG